MSSRQHSLIGNWPRYVLEWGVMALVVFFLVRLGSESALSKSVTFLTATRLTTGIIFAGAVILFGKLFCGYICPVGTVEDFIIKLRRAVRLKSIVPFRGSPVDRILRIVKYILLFLIFFFAMTSADALFPGTDTGAGFTALAGSGAVRWLVIVSIILIVPGGLLVDNFWCRYVCPLGALSDTLRFWLWCAALAGLYLLINAVGIKLPLEVLPGAICLMGYILEAFYGKSHLQLLSVRRDSGRCRRCEKCEALCPYHVPVHKFNGKVTDIDCNLCGDCVAGCPSRALRISLIPRGYPNLLNLLFPAVLTIALVTCALSIDIQYEKPDFEETWSISDNTGTVLMDSLEFLGNPDASALFIETLKGIGGVNGVRLPTDGKQAAISYNPDVLSPDSIRNELFAPLLLRRDGVNWKTAGAVKQVSILADSPVPAFWLREVWDRLQNGDEGDVYALESAGPQSLSLCSSASFDASVLDSLCLTGITITEEKELPLSVFAPMMFTNSFSCEFPARKKAAVGRKQHIYEIQDWSFASGEIVDGLPFASEYLGAHEGIIGISTVLDENYVPVLQIRYFYPMVSANIWSILAEPIWSYTDRDGNVQSRKSDKIYRKEFKHYRVL